MNGSINAATVKELWSQRLKQSNNKVFLIESNRQYSYGEIGQLVDEKAALLTSSGIKQGDLVALQFELDVEDITTILACIKIGAVINPLNPHFDIDEVENLVNRFKPFAIISQKSVRGRDTINNFISLEHYQTKEIGDLKLFIRNDHLKPLFSDNIGKDTPIIIINTSGTSGLPKGVILSNKNVLSAERKYNRAFSITSNEMILLLSGMYHAIGFHHGLISTIMAGSTIVILQHYDINQVQQLLVKWPITCIDSLPTIMYDLLFKVKNLGKLRMLICGGDKIKDGILQKAKERKVPLYNCYGLTEAVPFSYTPPDYFAEHGKMTTAVTPMAGIKTRIVKDHRVIKKTNVQGLIEVAGPIIFKGYLNNLKKTTESFDGKWFITGDIGHYNQDGLFEIDGRSSDKIIRGGENISAHIIEDKIRSCHNIKDVAVLGVPDIRLGQRIGAFVVLDDGKQFLTKDELLDQLKEHKVDKKLWPEKLWVVDSLPKTANGKVKKYLLKNWLEGKIANEK